MKIKGTEGFLLRQGTNEYNAFCPADIGSSVPIVNPVQPSAMILDTNSFVAVKMSESEIASLSNLKGCKIRIVFSSCAYTGAAFNLNDAKITFTIG